MRLWHKDLIPVLPRQQLLGQWRECCLIAKSISEKGTPNTYIASTILKQCFKYNFFNGISRFGSRKKYPLIMRKIGTAQET